jgi:hypothetical protein
MLLAVRSQTVDAHDTLGYTPCMPTNNVRCFEITDQLDVLREASLPWQMATDYGRFFS